MYKIPANTVIVGKKIEYLPQCHSTNDVMMTKAANGQAREGDILLAGYQSAGKGQRDAKWQSEPGQNLLMSICLMPRWLPAHLHYLLTVMTGVAVAETVRNVSGRKDVTVKWPNDVYVSDQKIAGILTESSWNGSNLEHVIVGIGLNVMQQWFEWPNATSLYLASQVEPDFQTTLDTLLLSIDRWYLKLRAAQYDELIEKYHNQLYRRARMANYEDIHGQFVAELIGINENGHLILKTNDGTRVYKTKEVAFLP